MAFTSDGERTWDPLSGMELVRTGRGREYQDFKISGPLGEIYFFAEWLPRKIRRNTIFDRSDNPNMNNIIEWVVYLNDLFPNCDQEKTKEIIRNAMKSFESNYGNPSLRGAPVRAGLVRFGGKFRDARDN